MLRGERKKRHVEKFTKYSNQTSVILLLSFWLVFIFTLQFPASLSERKKGGGGNLFVELKETEVSRVRVKNLRLLIPSVGS